MALLLCTKSIGVTVKFIIEGDEKLAQALLDSLPGDLTIGGVDLPNVRLGMRGQEVDPVRVAIRCEDVTWEEEDDFLENG